MNFNSQPTGEDSSDQRTHPHLRRSQKQGQAADGVRRMVRRPQCGYFHCGAVLRQSWRPDDEDHSAVLPQVFRPVLRVVLGTEKDELGSGLSICFVSLPGQRDQKPFGGAYFRDMSGCELAEIEQAAGQKCQPSVISATTTRRRSGSPSTGNCMRNMSTRMRSSAFRMCLP